MVINRNGHRKRNVDGPKGSGKFRGLWAHDSHSELTPTQIIASALIDKPSRILLLEPKAFVRSPVLSGLILEWVPALGDNHSHVKLRRHIHCLYRAKEEQ